jgi:branched-chain amino acid transport system permease protein
MGNFVLSKVNLISFAVCLISLIIFAFFFKKSRMGLAMRGTSENQKLAQSEGVKVTMVFSISWFIAIIMASTAGILLASLCSVDAEAIQFFGMKTIPVVILGGLESITGALLAGLVIGFAEMFTAYYLDPIVGSGFSGVTPFIVLMVILLIKPYGFFGYRRIERI